MAETVEELVVKVKPEGVEETTQQLEQQGEQFEQTAETAGEQTNDLEGFSRRWKGAMATFAGGLAVATGALLSRVPVLGDTLAILDGILTGIAFQIDEQLRPGITGLNEDLLRLEEAVFEASGPLEAFEMAWRGIDDAVGGFVSAAIADKVESITGVSIPSGWLEPLFDLFTLDFLGLADDFRTLAGLSPNWGRDLINGFIAGIQERASKLGIVVGALGLTISKAFDLAPKAYVWARQTIEGFISGAREKLGALQQWIRENVFGTIEAALDLATEAFEWGRGIVQGFIDGVNDAIGALRERLNEIQEMIRQKLRVDIPNVSSSGGGGGGGAGGGDGNGIIDRFVDSLPQLAAGGTVSETGAAVIHRGERVVNARDERAGHAFAGQQRIEIPVMLDGVEITRAVSDTQKVDVNERGRF